MGRRFCSLDQTHSECKSTLGEIMLFCPQNRVNIFKKKVFIAIWDYIQPEFVGFMRADRPFFVWSSCWQRSNLGGGTRLPYNLSTEYT